jgi:hypothetical protein
MALFTIAVILGCLGYIGYSEGAFENVDIPFIGNSELTPEEKRNNFDFCVINQVAKYESRESVIDSWDREMWQRNAQRACAKHLK